MIFNKDKNGAQELRELTGNYYANNKFDKISGEIELATEELSSLIGDEAMKLAEKYYTEPDKDGYINIDQDEIVNYIVAEAKKDQMGDYEPEDILFVVQGEMEYGNSIGLVD